MYMMSSSLATAQNRDMLVVCEKTENYLQKFGSHIHAVGTSSEYRGFLPKAGGILIITFRVTTR
jgi:hypothetical protein